MHATQPLPCVIMQPITHISAGGRDLLTLLRFSLSRSFLGCVKEGALVLKEMVCAPREEGRLYSPGSGPAPLQTAATCLDEMNSLFPCGVRA